MRNCWHPRFAGPTFLNFLPPTLLIDDCLKSLADFIKNRIQEAPNWIMLPLLHLNRFGDKVYGSAMKRFQRSIPSIDPEQKLVNMANYAIKHVPYYRELYGNAIINSAEDFRKIFGFIDKDTVRANFDKFISDEAPEINHVELRTSGTSGKPMRFLMPANRYVTEMAFITRIWQRAGYDFGIKATIRRKQLKKGRDYMVNPVTREIIFDGCRSDEAYIRKIHSVMRRNNVSTLYGYPSACTKILGLFIKYNLDTSFIKLALLTSESVPAATYRFFNDRLGIKIATFYGHTEKLILIEQLDATPTFSIEPGYGHTEIIDENGLPANYGELVGTTFYNHVMPLLRYRTGDYARKTGETRRIDGIQKEILCSLEGRREQTMVTRDDGTEINISSIEIHDEYPLHANGIQFVQPAPGKLTVRIIPGKGYTKEGDEAFMLRYYGNAMLGEKNVTIQYVEELECLPNGKAPSLIISPRH